MTATLTRLEQETRAFHEDADELWRSMGTAFGTPAGYMQQLVRSYGFDSPLEAALAYTPSLAPVIDLRGRVRSGLIAHDLLALGFSAQRIAMLPQCMIAPFPCPAEALGWMYVAERGARVHGAARRGLVARWPRLAGAMRYLGAASEARWAQYVEALESFVARRGQQQQIVIGAHEGFRCALDWYGARADARQASHA